MGIGSIHDWPHSVQKTYTSLKQPPELKRSFVEHLILQIPNRFSSGRCHSLELARCSKF